MAITIKWDVTYKCNLNCQHCINGDLLGKTNDELDTAGVEEILGKLSKAKVAYVHLLGGEPTARNDFIEVMRAFERFQINFGFNTNGLKMNQPGILEECLKNTNLKNIIFSIEGPTEEINDTIRGKNVFKHIVRNMKKFIELKKVCHREDIKITVNTVASKKNLAYISDMIDFCIQTEVDELVLLQLIQGGNAKEGNDMLTFEDELDLVKVIAGRYESIKDSLKIVPRFTYPLAKKYAETVLHKEFPELRHMCGAGNGFAYINNKGELYPCDRYQKAVLESCSVDQINLLTNDFWEIWSKDRYNDLFEKSEGVSCYSEVMPCRECEYLQKSCFPCPVSMEGKVHTVNSCSKFLELIGKEEVVYELVSSK